MSYHIITNTYPKLFNKTMGDKEEIETPINSLEVDGAAANPSEATSATSPSFDKRIKQQKRIIKKFKQAQDTNAQNSSNATNLNSGPKIIYKHGAYPKALLKDKEKPKRRQETNKLEDKEDQWFDAQSHQDYSNDQKRILKNNLDEASKPAERNNIDDSSSTSILNSSGRGLRKYELLLKTLLEDKEKQTNQNAADKLNALENKIDSLHDKVYPKNQQRIIAFCRLPNFFRLTSQNKTYNKIDKISQYVTNTQDTLQKQLLLIDKHKLEIKVLKAHLALAYNDDKKGKTKSQINENIKQDKSSQTFLTNNDVDQQKQKKHLPEHQTTFLSKSKQVTVLNRKLHQNSTAIKKNLDEETKPTKVDKLNENNQPHALNMGSQNTVKNHKNLLTDEEKLNKQHLSTTANKQECFEAELTSPENSKKQVEHFQSFLTDAQMLQKQTNEFREHLNRMQLLVLNYTKKISLENIENEAENKYIQKTTEEIDTIRNNAEKYEDAIQQLRRNHSNKTYLHVRNELLNSIDKLENIESQDKEEIRKQRRAATIYVQRLLEQLETKIGY